MPSSTGGFFIDDIDRADHGRDQFDVVDANDVGAPHRSDHAPGARCFITLIDWQSERVFDQRFATDAQHQRSIGFDLVEPTEDRQILFLSFAEADARVEDQIVASQTDFVSERKGLLEKIIDVGDHINGSAIVSDDERDVEAGGGFKHRSIAMHGVDHVDAELDGGLSGRRLIGIDTDRDGASTVERAKDRLETVDLLVGADLIAVRACRLRAYIDDIGSVVDHLKDVLDRSIEIDPLTAVAERIGRDVQDAHHQRSPIENLSSGDAV